MFNAGWLKIAHISVKSGFRQPNLERLSRINSLWDVED